jgi:hypothetical protein
MWCARCDLDDGQGLDGTLGVGGRDGTTCLGQKNRRWREVRLVKPGFRYPRAWRRERGMALKER